MCTFGTPTRTAQSAVAPEMLQYPWRASLSRDRECCQRNEARCPCHLTVFAAETQLTTRRHTLLSLPPVPPLSAQPKRTRRNGATYGRFPVGFSCRFNVTPDAFAPPPDPIKRLYQLQHGSFKAMCRGKQRTTARARDDCPWLRW